MDELIINNLNVYGYHGVFAEENALGQMFTISLKLGLDLSVCAELDELSLSTDYGEVCKLIERVFKERRFKLIEACADCICNELFEKYAMIKSVDIEIKKPWAPIGSNLDYAAARLQRQRHRAFIGLGSNMNDRNGLINDAINMLKDEKGLKVTRVSKLVNTKAWGVTEQPDFLNGVCEIETTLQPKQLLKRLLNIENILGRVRKEKWGPRLIDLDLLFYDDLKLYTDDLIIPHPYAAERLFVLEPMAEIAPNFIHPTYNESIRNLKNKLQNKE